MLLKYLKIFFFLFFLNGCKEDFNYFPHSQGKIWDYKVLIKSDYKGNVKEKRLTITNAKTVKKGNDIIFSKLYSNGNISTFQKDKFNNEFKRIAGFVHLKNGYDEPVKKLIFPFLSFKKNEWTSISQLFITKGYQPPLRDFIPSSVFEMYYIVVSRNIKVEVKAGTFKNCIHIKGKGNSDFIADARSGPVKVNIESEEWFCHNIGLVKEKRIESTKASAFGSSEYYKELIEFKN